MRYYSSQSAQMTEVPATQPRTPDLSYPATQSRLASASRGRGWNYRFPTPTYGPVPTAEVIQGMQKLARLELAQWNARSSHSQQYLRDVHNVCDRLLHRSW